MKNSVPHDRTAAGGEVGGGGAASGRATGGEAASGNGSSGDVPGLEGTPRDGAADSGYAPPLSIAHLLRDTYRFFARSLVSHMSGSQISSHRVTMGQYYILKELWRENGLTQRELSKRIGIMEPTAVNTLKLMHRRGTIRKERNSRDRRKTNIFLTVSGKHLFREILPFAEAVNADAVMGFSDGELSSLRELLEKMRENLNGGDAGG